MTTGDPRIYLIGLTLLKGVGNVLARHLLQHFGEAEAVFTEKTQWLKKTPGVGEYTANQIKASRTDALTRAEKELAFIEKNKIRMYSVLDEDYPSRLRNCSDAPVVFYYRGNADLNATHILSFVGTRSASEYGLKITATILRELSEKLPGVIIVSGLAYGIDICAHRHALKNGLLTVGVLAHGLDRIYPSEHRNTAAEMLRQGGLLTDFNSGTSPDREHFLQRNRLIAGLADATIVVESAEKGGSLVTADIAFSYGREVFTFPGRIYDERSIGCNRLIQANKAGLIHSASDLIMALRWDTATKTSAAPQPMRIPFDTEKPPHPIIELLAEKDEFQINELATTMHLPVHQLLSTLFELEMAGHIRALPGGRYKLNI
jgi:DNA processing protein